MCWNSLPSTLLLSLSLLSVYDIRDESTEIGTIRLTVKCLNALERVNEEIQVADEMEESQEVEMD